MTADGTIIRSSSLTQYPACSRRSAGGMFRREIQGAGFEVKESTNSIAAAVGTAVHYSAKVMLDEKAKNGALPPLSVSTDAAVESVKDEASKGVIYDRESPGLNGAEKQVVKMARVYHHVVAPTIEPLLVEKRLEAEVPGSKQKLILSGQSDVVARVTDAVRDLKSSMRLGVHTAQIGSYSLLGRSHGIEIKAAIVDWVQRVSVKKPQPNPAVQSYNVADAETTAIDVLQAIDRDLTAFREGDPGRGLLPGDPRAFPANPASMLCTAKYCPHYGITGSNAFCREWMPKEDIAR